ncbi:MAG: fluoride efflux transporter CrcB [Spirochaetales bacterium]
MKDLFLIILGGGLGSACRYLISLAAGRRFGETFAWGTLAVNLLGCLFIGFLIGLIDRSIVSRTFRMLLVTGFLGGFTTFSTFSLESTRMIISGSIDKALINIGLNVIAGLGLTVGGLFVAARI